MRKYLRQIRKKFRTRSFLKQLVKPGDLCFDIGANVGEMSQYFLDLKAQVIAVEPQPECLKLLQTLSERNSKLTVVPQGVGQKTGQATLHLCNMNEVSTLSQDFIEHYQHHEYLSWDDTITIELTTLDHLIQTFGLPSFCKIDTEGWELSVLSGLSQPIKYLSFEYNRPLTSEAMQCVDRLEQLGEPVFNFVPYEDMQFAFKDWQTGSAFKKTFTKYAEPILTGDIYAHFPEADL